MGISCSASLDSTFSACCSLLRGDCLIEAYVITDKTISTLILNSIKNKNRRGDGTIYREERGGARRLLGRQGDRRCVQIRRVLGRT